jgi:hypothetical protein
MSIVIGGGGGPSGDPEAWQLTDWTFGHVEVEDGEHARIFDRTLAPPKHRTSCDCYYLFRATGNSSKPWLFDLSFASSHPKPEDMDLEMVVYGHLLEAGPTPDMDAVLSTLPAWVTPISFVSLWHHFTF